MHQCHQFCTGGHLASQQWHGDSKLPYQQRFITAVFKDAKIFLSFNCSYHTYLGSNCSTNTYLSFSVPNIDARYSAILTALAYFLPGSDANSNTGQEGEKHEKIQYYEQRFLHISHFVLIKQINSKYTSKRPMFLMTSVFFYASDAS